MELSKSQREEAIDKLKKSTSIAKYAFREALHMLYFIHFPTF